MLIAGQLRHRVTIKLPGTTVSADSRGEITGAATTLASDVPCSIETLSGREGEQARQVYAGASLKVQLWGDASWALTTKHYLVFGSRQLNIGHIDNMDQLDWGYTLLCGEDK